jgi:uncharacterized membrane protein YkvA (DUF1232 family)
MVWPGVTVFFVGAILIFAVDDDAGPVNVDAVGVITMIFGAALLAAGLIRAGRRRRRPVSGGARSVARGRGSLTDYRDQVYRTSRGKTFAMIAAVVYILSPIDIVPDVFLPVGIVDDATAFTWLLFAIGQEISRKRRNAV